ncbi:cryptochrome/photolyase family protein [Methylocella sp.]|uniref:cryptochrome/photolyase family protein n=1 Tax=Methylocella sp. TaxID=1978226 RepID=UPI003783C4D3
MAAPADQDVSLLWLREDLRLSDNPALAAALERGGRLLCAYVLEDAKPPLRPQGGAARWWLHGSLEALAKDMARRGGRLDLYRGEAEAVIPALAAAAGANGVYWSRRYGLAEREIDARIKAALRAKGVVAESFNARLAHEPWEIGKADGSPFSVYSAFQRAALAAQAPGAPLIAPTRLPAAPAPKDGPAPVTLEALRLRPARPDWAGGLRSAWRPGEAGARKRLDSFLAHGLARYALARDPPADEDAVSRLSPHLAFGEIGPRQILHALCGQAGAGAAKFRGELGWREFDYHLLFNHPHAAQENLQRRFDAMGWRDADADFRAWTQGLTGYPLVDAAMRELWTTGYMHNRARLVAASFLVKHLLIDWRRGEAWFWDTLCDADPANNPMNWQWVAGCGADAAPYFRIFNPVLQGEKFDPQGDYVRRHVVELEKLSARWIHRPWRAPEAALREAGVALGTTYPRPIVDHDAARARALAAFERVKTASP